MTIAENMFHIMEKKNIKAVQLAKKLNISNSVISSWKSRNTNPPSEYLIQICELLDVNIYQLLNSDIDTYADDEQMLLNFFRKCSDEDKQLILSLVTKLYVLNNK